MHVKSTKHPLSKHAPNLYPFEFISLIHANSGHRFFNSTNAVSRPNPACTRLTLPDPTQTRRHPAVRPGVTQ